MIVNDGLLFGFLFFLLSLKRYTLKKGWENKDDSGDLMYCTLIAAFGLS